MQIVVHRVNTVAALANVPTRYGVELDLRADGRELVLNHEPFQGGERFTDYLRHYRHDLMVLNIKEAGIEGEALALARQAGVRDCFLLDVEFPYLYRAARAGERAIAARYSEDESIETVLNYAGRIDWVWIDTNTRLPLDARVVAQLAPFRTCLVCPERWGRPGDIPHYRAAMRALHFYPDAVMTSLRHAPDWEAA